MSWLSTFDPGSQASSSSSNNHSQFRPPPSRPSRGGFRPQRARAAPPAASLRSEDSQPNEDARRSRPWERDAPPVIGSSKTRIIPSKPGQLQTRPRSAPPQHSLPMRPLPPPPPRAQPQQPPSSSRPVNPSTPRPPPSSPAESDKKGPAKLTKAERKRMRRKGLVVLPPPPPSQANAPIGLDEIDPEASTWSADMRTKLQAIIDHHHQKGIESGQRKKVKESIRHELYNAPWSPGKPIDLLKQRSSLKKSLVNGFRSKHGHDDLSPDEIKEMLAKFVRRWAKVRKHTLSSSEFDQRLQKEIVFFEQEHRMMHDTQKGCPDHPVVTEKAIEQAYLGYEAKHGTNSREKTQTSNNKLQSHGAKKAGLEPEQVTIQQDKSSSSSQATKDDTRPQAPGGLEQQSKPRSRSIKKPTLPPAKKLRETQSPIPATTSDRPPHLAPLSIATTTMGNTTAVATNDLILEDPSSVDKAMEPQQAQPLVARTPFSEPGTPVGSPRISWPQQELSLPTTSNPLQPAVKVEPEHRQLSPTKRAATLRDVIQLGSTSAKIRDAEASAFALESSDDETMDEAAVFLTPDRTVAAASTAATTIQVYTPLVKAEPVIITIDDSDDEEIPLANQVSTIASTALLSLNQPAPIVKDESTDLAAEEDSDEDIPLWQEQERRSASAAPSRLTAPTQRITQIGSTETLRPESSRAQSAGIGSLIASVSGILPLLPVPQKPHISIAHLVPIASRSFNPSGDSRTRRAAYDTAVAVSSNGRIACMGPCQSSLATETFYAQRPKFRSVSETESDQIDRVEGVARLTSKVVGIASSTSRVLGIAQEQQPHQVSLVTTSEEGYSHKTYCLGERPHPQGALAISPFPNTAPDDPTSIDFATGGADGVVNHWRWSTNGNTHVSRLHTIHGLTRIVAMEHLPVRHGLLLSASLGMTVGFDINSLCIRFSWPTSERVVHLQRTPNPDLMLATSARKDYDQFRLYDVTGRAGPISHSVISFGWLNNAQGRIPMGKGCFHPIRKSVFAHGSEDGKVRLWDLRSPRDPLLVADVSDEPVSDVLWKAEDQNGVTKDTMYVATAKGVRTVDLEMIKA